MKFIKNNIKNSYLIALDKYEDKRGFFARVFCKKEFSKIGINLDIVQSNQSLTKTKGSIRGMHFQMEPFAETKIIKCLSGTIYDVIIDLRKDSPSFNKYFGTELSSKEKNMLIVPKGCAHGFQTLEDNTEIFYFVTQYYNPDSERGIRWNDPKFKISWPIQVTSISDKDKNWPDFDEEKIK